MPALETAVFLQPEDGVAWARLGCAYQQTGRSADAAPAFARGIELGCRGAWMWFWAGAAAAALGDREGLERARRELELLDARLARDLEDEVRSWQGVRPGFRWWPAELEQEVWAEPAWDDEGLAVNLFLGMLQRARWAAESVFGEEWAGREPSPDAEAVTGT